MIVRLLTAFAALALPLPGRNLGISSTAAAPLAAGHTYVVNSTLDEPDNLPASGICSSTPSGKCTLRAAIMVANVAAGPNTIILPAGTYVITRPGYDDSGYVGDFAIGQDVTIQGAGSGATIVDGNGAVIHDRVFQVLNTTQNVTLTAMTIRNGQSLSRTVGVIGGGGIYMEGTGHLLLSNVIIEGNTGQNGGGLYANFSSQGGSVEMDHVIVRANTAIAGGVGEGGGSFVYLPSSLSAVDLHDSLVYSNTADGIGGGFFVDGNSTAHWSIERSQIYSNTAASGGGIGNFVPLAVYDSRLHDNHASFDGGAMEAFSPFAVTRTTLDANTAGRFGGGIFGLQDSGSLLYANFAYIVQSTLSGNSAQYGGGIYHDGFITPGSLMTLINSTLSGNGVYRPGGATGAAEGGGIYVYGGQVQLLNATIASNRVQLGFGIHQYPGIGGGLYITASATLTAENSIIANNVRGNGITLDVPDDCFSSGTTGTLSYDLILTTTNCFVTGGQVGLIVGQNPLLGPLQNNGGSTQTQALLPGSPAIDAGFSTGCIDDLGLTLTTDQRGAPRPAFGDPDPTCDMGAYELVPEADLALAQRASPNPVRLQTRLTYTVVLTNTGPATATGIVLTDTLPASATVSAVDTGTVYGCVVTAVLICNFGPMTLPSGANITVTVAVTPTALGVITNTVTVTGNEFDPVLANNTASVTTAVVTMVYLPLIARGP